MPEDRRDNTALLQQIKDLIDPVNDKTDRILRALYGNGDYDKGIVAQVAVNRSFRERTQKQWSVIIGAVVTAALSAVGSLVLFFIKRL